MDAWTKRAMAVGLVVAGMAAGCHRGSARPTQSVSPDQFYTRGQGVAATPFSNVDQPGALRDSEVDAASSDRGATVTNESREPGAGAPGGRPITPNESREGPISDTVKEQIRPPATGPSGLAPNTANTSVATKTPTTGPAGASEGTYMTLGGVVAEVNGTPIYANNILKLLDTVLATKARELEPEQFEKFAKAQIDRQLRELISNELEFAAAERNLDQADRGLAEMLTIKWRSEQITLAGGSVEMARKKASADGADFEDMVNQRYRFHMTQVYYQKKVIPQIQVSADDMRRYYQANLTSEFTQQEKAEFRLIKVDPKLHPGGRDEAYKIVKDVRERATTGKEDFAQLSAEFNDDPRLKKSGGDLGLGPVQRGAFALEDIEKAAFALKPDEVSDVIEAKGSFYLIKLVSRTTGQIKAFEDPDVQENIRRTLRGKQFAQRRDQVRSNLEKGAVIRVDDDMLKTSVDMAMQRYTQWAAK